MNKSKNFGLLGAVVTGISMLGGISLPSGLVQAAELEEIVVFAQRRQQSLQDVGVSVAALSEEDLRDRGITNAQDIAEGIAGVTFVANAGGVASAPERARRHPGARRTRAGLVCRGDRPAQAPVPRGRGGAGPVRPWARVARGESRRLAGAGQGVGPRPDHRRDLPG